MKLNMLRSFVKYTFIFVFFSTFLVNFQYSLALQAQAPETIVTDSKDNVDSYKYFYCINCGSGSKLNCRCHIFSDSASFKVENLKVRDNVNWKNMPCIHCKNNPTFGALRCLCGKPFATRVPVVAGNKPVAVVNPFYSPDVVITDKVKTKTLQTTQNVARVEAPKKEAPRKEETRKFVYSNEQPSPLLKDEVTIINNYYKDTKPSEREVEIAKQKGSVSQRKYNDLDNDFVQ